MKLYFVLAVLVSLPAVSYAATITLSGTLSGANESPATGSPGMGSATAILDTTAQTLEVIVVFSGLFAVIPGTSTASGTTASHIHCCTPFGGNAGVATTTPTFPGFPLSVDSGMYDHTFDLTMASSYNPSFVSASGGLSAAETALVNGLLNNQTYLNIHTNAFPGGEIRAFLAVPESTTWIPALAGLASLALIRRVRRT